MKLEDEIERVGSGQRVPAYVYYRNTASAPVEHEGTRLFFGVEDTLLAIVEPGNYSVDERIRWRGRTYEIGHVAVRRRGGEDHHVTLTLESP
jgi:hypothetical protein